ncbi:MAG TPA: SufE family protein [Saprospiraceae bacterium]|nr:SufE family protein [Saprospiraceae bacterium]
MPTIDTLQQTTIEEFGLFDDWAGKYEYLIDLGKKLPLIDHRYKTDTYRIKGCQSQVWLNAEMRDGKLYFTADSDAIITKGLIALLVRVLSGQDAQDIAHADLYFIDRIGLREHLSPTRSNGLAHMIDRMKMSAQVFTERV